jgi:hypothetical protein
MPTPHHVECVCQLLDVLFSSNDVACDVVQLSGGGKEACGGGKFNGSGVTVVSKQVVCMQKSTGGDK